MFELVTMRRSTRACNDHEQVLNAFNDACEMTMALKDEPYPYAVTVNYAPVVKDNELYLVFHGAKAGRKLELLHRDPHCAFTITLRTQVVIKELPHKSTNFFRSISGEGTMLFLEGEAAQEAIVALMAHHGYDQDLEQLKRDVVPHLKATQMFALKVERAGLKEIVPH